jgi:hypothetical protein
MRSNFILSYTCSGPTRIGRETYENICNRIVRQFARLDVGLRNNVYPNRQGRIANQQSVSKLSQRVYCPGKWAECSGFWNGQFTIHKSTSRKKRRELDAHCLRGFFALSSAAVLPKNHAVPVFFSMAEAHIDHRCPLVVRRLRGSYDSLFLPLPGCA